MPVEDMYPPICKRAENDHDHDHTMVEMPFEILSQGFKRPQIPLFVCRTCDGEVFRNAIKENDRRNANL